MAAQVIMSVQKNSKEVSVIMNFKNKTQILIKALMIFSFCQVQFVQADNSKVVGVYEGIIWSNSDQLGTTEFYLIAEEKIEAKYIFKGTNGDHAVGILNNCSLKALLLHCIWNDDYGKGDFVVEFNSDFSSFSGKWFDDTSAEQRSISEDSGHLWSGTRKK